MGGEKTYKVSWVEIHFLQRASSFFEPLHVALFEDEEIFEINVLRWFILMVVLLSGLAEKLIEQLAATFHQNQTTIIRAVWLVVQKPLYALHSLAMR